MIYSSKPLTFFLNVFNFVAFCFSCLNSICRSTSSSEPQTSNALFSTCKHEILFSIVFCPHVNMLLYQNYFYPLTWSKRYNFISPHLELCGFLPKINRSGGERKSISQSFNKYSFLASVLVIKSNFSFPNLSLLNQNYDYV